jgi:hypothetical protein
MAVTELEEVQALLVRVLPDPSGFAQRLLLQLMGQFGQSAEPGAGAFNSSARAFYTAATGEDVTAPDIVITPEQPGADEALTSTHLLLAAALGACECWGLQADCDVCRGYGSAGWTEPVPELFYEFVGPAIAKLPDIPADELGEPASEEPDRRDNHRTEEEERS